jgi:Lon protease-like protein
MSDAESPLADFRGTARLFPLPNLVLFPFVVQPLHVFEPRYRQLMEDALASDRLVALALLKPGWEADYNQRPPIYPGVCLGRIFKEERLADGRFNLLLHGVQRGRVVEELKTDRLYRTARIELIEEVPVISEAVENSLRLQLGQRVEAWFQEQDQARDQLRQLLQSSLPLGTLSDVFAYALPLAIEGKQELLEESDVERRARRLLALLDSLPVLEPAVSIAGRKFPPDFSAN